MRACILFSILILGCWGFAEAVYSQNQFLEAWTKYYAYSGTESDYIGLLAGHAVDQQGNIYCAAKISRQSWDYFVVKYNPDGLILWTTYYDYGIYDVPTAICTDESGNVYVTGKSYNSATGLFDYATVKYNTDGEQVWVARFNGGFSINIQAPALAFITVDNAGNVYLTGSGYTFNTDWDYLTIKYNASGTEQWAVYYNNSSANFSDLARALVLDNAGNVYVSGVSYGNGTNNDYATVKYNSAGQQLWVDRYDGPASSGDGARALGVDSNGNVYVTGISARSTGSDYATIKYNAGGVIQWIARYDGGGAIHNDPGSIFVSSDGVVVSGTSDQDYLTVKYNLDGQQLWNARYQGPGDYDLASDMIVDSLGNIYVTGESRNASGKQDFTTIKYNSAGIIQWLVRDNYAKYCYNPLIAFDPSGNLILAGMDWNPYPYPDLRDYEFIKYSTDGVRQWAAVYQEDYIFYQPNAMVLDDEGNAYITGFLTNPDSMRDFITLKCTPEGVVAWATRYDGPDHGDDCAQAIAIDAAGNIYVTGESKGIGTGDDYAVVKYGATGQQKWVARYDGPASTDDRPKAIAIDDAGNVYITGQSDGSGSGADYATIKYDTSGTQQWISRYNGPGNSTDYPIAIKLDRTGNIYVTGSSTGLGTERDYLTIKYTTNGTEVWTARYHGPGDDIDYPVDLAVDVNGNVYVTGTSWGGVNISYWDYATIKYDPNGNEEWIARYDSPGGSQLDDFAEAIEVDAQGNVYVTGSSSNADYTFDFATIKYNPSGSIQWVARHDGYLNGHDWARALALDPLGNVYVTGSIDSSGIQEISTLKYDTEGNLLWEMRKGYADDAADGTPTALLVDELGNIYITGYTGESLDWRIMTIIRYIQEPPVAIGERPGATLPSGFRLEQNYPNPFNPTTTISFTLPQASPTGQARITLQVYDVTGRKVRTLISGQMRAGRHQVVWDGTNDAGQPVASGVYLYRLRAGDFQQARKMVLLR